MKTIAVVLVALVGIAYGDARYFRSGGTRYPSPVPGYRSPGLGLPPNCGKIHCYFPACLVERCPNHPEAQCVGFCNDCVARFFADNVNVTPSCHGL